MQQKIISILLIPIILGYIIFEEIVWERIARPLFRFISQLEILQKLEARLHITNSKVILGIFILLFVVVEFMGIFAAGYFLNGNIVTGIMIYATKIPISAFTFWIFQVTQQKLMEFNWFKVAYQFIMKMINKITHSQVYSGIKARAASIKHYIKNEIMNDEGSIKMRIKLIYRKLKMLLNKNI
ncbi:MAG: hypothetical protein V3U84_01250 [Thiotrichaceae bacterium]